MLLSEIGIRNLKPLDDDVWVGGQPSAAQLGQAKEAGLASVITLCPPHECGWDERAVAAALGLRFESIAIASGGDLTRDAAHRLHELLESLPRPVLVHCGSANRVGALFALRACFVEGHAPEIALERGRRAGMTGLEATVLQILRS